jgi:hypothetical protein
MSFWRGRICLFVAAILCALSIGTSGAMAQGATGTIRGTVTDPSNGAIAGASIIITSAVGQSLGATTSKVGAYEVKGLALGVYKVEAMAKGFALYEKDGVQVKSSDAITLDITLKLETEQQKVTVSAEAPNVDVSPENNAGAVVISGKALDALSDDPDELQADLQALAGPSAGPNGGQMYIDGFTAGQLPPKSSIREIRINQNPFSSEYDKLGYGRIEIFTKPGTDKFHGQFEVMGNTAGLNTDNPFLPPGESPSYDKVQYNGSFGGPLSKKASFFISAQRRDLNDLGIVFAPAVLDANNNIVNNFSEDVPTNTTRTNVGPRLDYQLTKNNTLTVRYQYWRDTEENQGVGGTALPSQGYNTFEDEQQVQASDTQMIGTKVVNETRFQFLRDTSNQNPASTAFQVAVQGAFTGGGSGAGTSMDVQSHYELQNYTSWLLGNHFLKFGVRLRDLQDNNYSASGFNGSYSFSSIQQYQAAQQAIAAGTAIPVADYPTQFSLSALTATGSATQNVNLFDVGLYVQDDWRVRPNITLSYGLRFESQDHIEDHADIAPRVALAWGLARGKNAPKTVLRFGWGIFYDRFAENLVLNAERYNGLVEQVYTITNPSFYPEIPAPGSPLLATSNVAPTTYRIAPDLAAPYTMQTAATLERQLGKLATLSVTYMNSMGHHQLFTNNINAPEPGTFAAGDPVYPITGSTAANIYEFESGGAFKENQLIVNTNVRAGARAMIFGYYTLTYYNADTSGASSFPSNPYDILADYGRAGQDVRSRFFLGGSIGLRYGFRLSPFMTASSGRPFNVTLPVDLIGSSIFNQRPAFAGPLSNPANVVSTPLGNFDTVPQPGETIVPINDFTGPGSFSLNLRFSKTFGFGKPSESSGKGQGQGGNRGGGGGGGDHGHGGPGGPFGGGGGMFGGMGGDTTKPYSLTLSVNARNVFNNVNLANPVGTIGSPSFDKSIALAGGGFGPGGGGGGSSAANRLLYLQASFSF